MEEIKEDGVIEVNIIRFLNPADRHGVSWRSFLQAKSLFARLFDFYHIFFEDGHGSYDILVYDLYLVSKNFEKVFIDK